MLYQMRIILKWRRALALPGDLAWVCDNLGVARVPPRAMLFGSGVISLRDMSFAAMPALSVGAM